MQQAVQHPRYPKWKIAMWIVAGAIGTLTVLIALLLGSLWARAYHPKAGSCPNATAEWKHKIISEHVQSSNLPDFEHDGKDVELVGGDSWDEKQGIWLVPFTTGHGLHRLTAIITCDGVSEFSGR